MWSKKQKRKTAAAVLADIDDVELARYLGLTRVGLGAVALLTPRRAGWLWSGKPAESTNARLALRGLGGRDIALGLGLLMALEKGAPVRGWLEAGVVADASDMVAVLSTFDELPWFTRLTFLTTAAGAVALGLTLASSMD